MGTGPSRPRSAPSAREGAPAKRARYHGGRRMGCRGVAIVAVGCAKARADSLCRRLRKLVCDARLCALQTAHRVCSKLRHGCEKTFDVLGARQSMVAILHQREDDVVLGKWCGKLVRGLPGEVGVLHALEHTGG